MIDENEIYKIGLITRTHGTKGEVEMRFTDDVFDRVDADYVFIIIDGLPVPFFFEEWRFKNNEVAIVKFLDVDDEDDANMLCGNEVYFPLEDIPEDEATPLNWNYFEGFRVLDANGDNVGIVESIDSSSSNILMYVIADNGDELILPLNENLLLEHNSKTRFLRMEIPEGLLTLNK